MKNKKLIIAIILSVIVVLGGVTAAVLLIKPDKEENTTTKAESDTTTQSVDTITVVTNEDVPDSDKLKCEYKYYYVNMHQTYYNQSMQYEMLNTGMGVMYTGFDCNKLPENQAYPYEDYKLPDGSTPTWKQYFEYVALRSVREMHALEDLAEKDGFSTDRSVLDDAYASIDQLKTQLSEIEPDQTFDAWLSKTYGSNMTENIFKDIIRRQTIASEYVTVLSQKLYEQNLNDNTVLETEYNKNPDLYNYVGVRIFAIYESGSEGRNKANEFLSKITDEESFKKLAEEYATAEQKAVADYSSDETTLEKYLEKEAYRSTLGDTAVNWLFNKDTKVGDKKVFEYNDAFFVFYMVKTSYRDDATIPVDVRHILYTFDETAADQEADKAAKKTEAEATLNAINQSSDKLATFIEYCNKDSDDSGSADNGGLYEYVGRGQYVKNFEEWSLDPNRKEGDVGIIETEYGYHVMYFVKKHSAPMWKIIIAQSLVDDSYTALIDDTLSSSKYDMLSSDTINSLNEELYAKTIENYYSSLN